MSKKNIMLVVGFVVVALIAFYAGTAYSKSKSAKAPQDRNQAGFGMQNGQFGQKGMRTGGGNVFGQIIAKDANSITVEIKAPTNQGVEEGKEIFHREISLENITKLKLKKVTYVIQK